MRPPTPAKLGALRRMAMRRVRTPRDFQGYVDEYVRDHYYPAFDDYDSLGGKQYGVTCRESRYIVINQKRLFHTLRAFDRFFRPGMSVLDIGCFPGMLPRLLRIIYGHSLEIHGTSLELSDEFIRVLNDRYSVPVYEVNLDLYRHVSEIEAFEKVPNRIPVESPRFDFVFATEVIEHLFTPTLLLRESNRVLKGSGLLCLTTPNLFSVGNIVRLLRGTSPFAGCDDVSCLDHPEQGAAHLRIYSLKEVKHLLGTFGFQVLQSEYLSSDNEQFRIRRGRSFAKRIARCLYCPLDALLLRHVGQLKDKFLVIAKKVNPV